MSNPKSTASIAGHPIHPMLIPFPIAFFVATFVCDLAYWQSPNDAWVYRVGVADAADSPSATTAQRRRVA
jgi:uncharacterized membrane protein